MIIGLSGLIKSGKDECGNILFNNFIKSGKDAKLIKFADPIKDFVCILTGLTREEIEDRTLKEKPLGSHWVCWSYKDELFIDKEDAINILMLDYCYVKESNINYNKTIKKLIDIYIKKIELTPRKLLTLIGTTCGRKIIHPNIWVNATFKNYTKDQIWIVTDVRFPNEVKKIEEFGGILVNITRDESLKFPIEYKCFEDYNKTVSQKETFLSYIKKYNSDLFYDITHESETSLDNYKFKNVIENNFSLDYLEKEILKIVNI